MDENFAPHEYKTSNYVLEFDENGDVVSKPNFPDYVIYAYDDHNHQDEPVRKNMYL